MVSESARCSFAWASGRIADAAPHNRYPCSDARRLVEASVGRFLAVADGLDEARELSRTIVVIARLTQA
jgi:hypothetical protein